MTISGNNQGGAFQVDAGVTASISGLTITGGATLESGGHGDGSINDLGTLTLSDCTITNNPLATTSASGVYVDGTADLTDCTITGGNSYYGAGVDVVKGTADLTGCTIDDNTGEGNVVGAGVFNGGNDHPGQLHDQRQLVRGRRRRPVQCSSRPAQVVWLHDQRQHLGERGAGVYNRGTADLSDCTISGNSNDNSGGGVWNQGTIDLSGCTISGNTASIGGGLDNDSGTATLVACTISGNTATGSGGGIYVGGTTGTNTVTLNNTIVAGNDSAPTGGSASPSDIAGLSVSGSNNLVGIGGSAGLSSSTNTARGRRSGPGPAAQ